jgi:hypothetical protein
MHSRLLKTLSSLAGATPELLDKIEEIVAQVETLEAWLMGR